MKLLNSTAYHCNNSPGIKETTAINIHILTTGLLLEAVTELGLQQPHLCLASLIGMHLIGEVSSHLKLWL